MALPQDDQLKLLAKMKAGLRYTDSEVAAHFGVTPRTIQRWLRETAYGEAVRVYQDEQKTQARAKLSGLADDVIDNLYSLMTSSRSDLVRFNAGKTLGEWLGMADTKEQKPEDNRDEVIELQRRLLTDKPSPIYLPPPGSGGRLPEGFVDGEVVEDEPTTDPKDEEADDGEDLIGELTAAREKFSTELLVDS